MKLIDRLNYDFKKEDVEKIYNSFNDLSWKFLEERLKGKPRDVYNILNNLSKCKNKFTILKFARSTNFKLQDILLPISYMAQLSVNMNPVYKYYSKVKTLDNDRFDVVDNLKLHDNDTLDRIYYYFLQHNFVDHENCDKGLNIGKKYLAKYSFQDFHYLMKTVPFDVLTEHSNIILSIPDPDEAISFYNKINSKILLDERLDYSLVKDIKSEYLLEQVAVGATGYSEALAIEDFMAKYKLNVFDTTHLAFSFDDTSRDYIAKNIDYFKEIHYDLAKMYKEIGSKRFGEFLQTHSKEQINAIVLQGDKWFNFFSRHYMVVDDTSLFLKNTLKYFNEDYQEKYALHILNMTKEGFEVKF